MKINPIISDELIIYRGWMCNEVEYTTLSKLLSVNGNSLINTPTQYLNCHHLPKWYNLVKEFTAETIIYSVDDLESSLINCNWDGYFIKDFVKSVTTKKGSIAKSKGEVLELVNVLDTHRGIEGGICIRKLEHYIQYTEERYFVFYNKVFSVNGIIPEMVYNIASRIDSNFFCIDIITNTKGELRLVEIGDGQVSDLKNWTPHQFISIFNQE